MPTVAEFLKLKLDETFAEIFELEHQRTKSKGAERFTERTRLSSDIRKLRARKRELQNRLRNESQ